MLSAVGGLRCVFFGTILRVPEGRGAFLVCYPWRTERMAVVPAGPAPLLCLLGGHTDPSFGGTTLLLFSVCSSRGIIPPAETVTCPWPVSVSCPSHGHCNRLKDGRMKVLPRNLERDTLFLPVWLIGQCKPPVAGTLL